MSLPALRHTSSPSRHALGTPHRSLSSPLPRPASTHFGGMLPPISSLLSSLPAKDPANDSPQTPQAAPTPAPPLIHNHSLPLNLGPIPSLLPPLPRLDMPSPPKAHIKPTPESKSTLPNPPSCATTPASSGSTTSTTSTPATSATSATTSSPPTSPTSVKSFAFISHSLSTFPSQAPEIDDAQLARRKRRRTSPNELGILQKEFGINPRPSKAKRLEIAAKVAMTEKAVQVWFQNRRQSLRRHSCSDDAMSSVSPERLTFIESAFTSKVAEPDSESVAQPAPNMTQQKPSTPTSVNYKYESDSTDVEMSPSPKRLGLRLLMSTDGKAVVAPPAGKPLTPLARLSDGELNKPRNRGRIATFSTLSSDNGISNKENPNSKPLRHIKSHSKTGSVTALECVENLLSLRAAK